jgi:murein DD-endopeptidase MepM/ murein hydrolase activator NlpD
MVGFDLKRALTGFLTIALLLTYISVPTVAALSTDQKKVLDTGIYYFNTEESITGCATSVNLTGSDNQQKIFNFLTSKGLQPFQAAGIMGNMAVESGFEPQRLQGTDIGVKTPAESFSGSLGWGIVQWTPGSKFIDTNNPKNRANDLGVQLQFLWDQLEGRGPLSEKQAGDDVKAAPNVMEAVKAFQGTKNDNGKYSGFERPADETGSLDTRTAKALTILQTYGSGAAADSSSDSTLCGTTDSSGEIVGSLSLPVAKSWYTKHPDWFTKPHHDYPAADIPVPPDTPVYSVSDGKVIAAPAGDTCGNGVIIDASDGTRFTYCHGSDGGLLPGVKTGDTVKAGQLIMHSGYTGHVDPPGPAGAHLHLGIAVNGQNVCPQRLLIGIATGSVPNIKSLPSTGCTY